MDNKNEVRPLIKTKGGKTVGWRVKEGSNLMEFAFVEGGELPEELKGSWTSIKAMLSHALSYVTSKAAASKSKTKDLIPEQATNG